MAQPRFKDASLASDLRSNPAATARTLSLMRDDAEARLNAAATLVEHPGALGTIDVSTFQDGAFARAAGPRSAWILVRSSDLTPADGLVIANGSDRWVRVEQADAGHRVTPVWYVSSSGDVYADGTTSGAPITIPEVQRRLAHRTTSPVSVHLLDSITDDLDVLSDGPADPRGYLELTGTQGRTTVASGTVTAYTPPEPGSPGTRGELTASISLTAHVGRMARVTSGARAGTQFPIAKATTGGKAEIGIPEGTEYTGDDVVLQAGDAFVIETLPTLGGHVATMGDGDISFSNLVLGDVGEHTFESAARVAFFNSCIIRALDITRGAVQLLNCKVEYALRIGQADLTVFESVIGSGATLRCDARSTAVFTNTISYTHCYVHQASDVRISGWMSFRDCPHTFRVMPGGTLRLVNEDGVYSTLWGENIAGTIGRLRVEPAGTVVYKSEHLPLLNGSGTEYKIGPDAKTAADLPYVAANKAGIVLG